MKNEEQKVQQKENDCSKTQLSMANKRSVNFSKENDNVKTRKKCIENASTKVSSVLRQFILAGIGVVWLFRVTGSDGAVTLNYNLMLALKFFVGAILSEFLHYLYEISVNAIYLSGSLRSRNMPSWVAIIPWFLWIIKLLLVFLAYVHIGSFLFVR